MVYSPSCDVVVVLRRDRCDDDLVEESRESENTHVCTFANKYMVFRVSGGRCSSIGGWENVDDKRGNRVPCAMSVSVSCETCRACEAVRGKCATGVGGVFEIRVLLVLPRSIAPLVSHRCPTGVPFLFLHVPFVLSFSSCFSFWVVSLVHCFIFHLFIFSIFAFFPIFFRCHALSNRSLGFGRRSPCHPCGLVSEVSCFFPPQSIFLDFQIVLVFCFGRRRFSVYSL